MDETEPAPQERTEARSGPPAPPEGGPSAPALAEAFREELHPARQSAVLSWLAFATTFASVRAITHAIRDGRGPLHDLTPGGLHLHHYLWGISRVSGVGGVTLRGSDRTRRHPAVAVAYGVGMALIVDEFALLLDLRDVYWAREGRSSVDLGVGLIAAAGLTLEARPVLRRLRRERLAGRGARR
ncbi:MAG: hypothetical protein M0T80_02625 [Actinomycetota bacterium]|nr:hypothetical protein [Actinomycetota bacterium]